jgi:hypothetical protein
MFGLRLVTLEEWENIKAELDIQEVLKQDGKPVQQGKAKYPGQCRHICRNGRCLRKAEHAGLCWQHYRTIRDMSETQ